MAKPYAHQFYKSGLWQTCRDEYARMRGHLCERCISRGVLTYGEIVHHKIPLTPDNITDPKVTLNFDNLQLLCRRCHAEVHSEGHRYRRFTIGPDGEIIIDTPPDDDENCDQR